MCTYQRGVAVICCVQAGCQICKFRLRMPFRVHLAQPRLPHVLNCNHIVCIRRSVQCVVCAFNSINMAAKNDLLMQLIAVTGAEPDVAMHLLEVYALLCMRSSILWGSQNAQAANSNIEDAVQLFFELKCVCYALYACIALCIKRSYRLDELFLLLSAAMLNVLLFLF